MDGRKRPCNARRQERGVLLNEITCHNTQLPHPLFFATL